MNTALTTLARAFHSADRSFYLVGGTVRDELLGLPCSDIDACTDALPDEIREIAAKTAPTHIVPIGEKFGTIQLHYENSPIIEVTTYRGERYTPGSRHPEVQFGTSLIEDLRRRDFTINAIAKDPLTSEFIDPFDGLSAIKQGLIEAVDDPAQRFRDDPLRLLRAVRFAAQLGFSIIYDTYVEILSQASNVLDISQEGIRDELNKILLLDGDSCFHGLYLLTEVGLMQHVLPEAQNLKGVDQHPYHLFDVYIHTTLVVKRVPARLPLRWAALLHDIAKPQTRTIDRCGAAHFYGHEDLGAEMATDILRRLRFPSDFIEYVSKIVKLHMRINAYTTSWSNAAVRRLFVDAGDCLDDLFDLAIADGMSDRGKTVDEVKPRIDELRERCRQVSEHVKEQPIRSPLNGEELMALFGRGLGPWLAPLKQHLQDLVIEGSLESDDKQGAVDVIREFVEKGELQTV